MSDRHETVESLARLVHGSAVGDASRVITGVADLRYAGEAEIGFVANRKYAKLAQSTGAAAVIVPQELEGCSASQIVVEHPYVAFAKVAQHLHARPPATEHRIHETAVVDASAKLESPVVVGPHVCIGAGSTVGGGTILRAGVVIGDSVRIGRNGYFHPRVTVYDDVTIGARAIIHAGAVLGSDGFGYAILPDGSRTKFPQLGTLILGDDVEIGANATLDRAALAATEIGSGSKLDNLVHIGHNCRIGSDTAIAALSAFAGETHIGNKVTIAGHVVAAGDLTVTDNVVIGGNSVLTGDVREAGVYAGYPLQPRAAAAKTVVIQGRLVELRQEVQELRRELARLAAEGRSGAEDD